MSKIPFKIAIGVVDNHPSLMKPFVLSLMTVMQYFQQWAYKQEDYDFTLDLLLAENGGVDDMRNAVANQAITQGYQAIFWMDSDMTFPPDCLIRMIQYLIRDGYEAVTGLYTYKTPPFMPHVYGRNIEGTNKFEIASGFPLKQPFKVEGAGFGCILMSTKVFERVPKPYFTMRFENGNMVEGEDLTFCAKAKMKMILDPTISCGHMKYGTFSVDDYVRSNGLSIEEDWVKCTKKQKDVIVKMLDKAKGKKT